MEIPPADAGMHLLGWLPAKTSDTAAARAAAAAGVVAPPISLYAARHRPRPGLILGYACVNARADSRRRAKAGDGTLPEAVKKLAADKRR